MNSDNHIEEAIREQEREKQHIADCVGTISYRHFEEFKSNAVAGMLKFGNAFIAHLGQALERADDIDSVKLMKVWQSQVAEHEMLYRIWRAKEEGRIKYEGISETQGCILKT